MTKEVATDTGTQHRYVSSSSEELDVVPQEDLRKRRKRQRSKRIDEKSQ
jgi:hypothetical protein